MKKPKLIFSQFDQETGLSRVIIRTPLGDFQGSAKLHPDDKYRVSSFAGCEYAMIRATIKYYKAVLKDYKTEYHALKKLYNKYYLPYCSLPCSDEANVLYQKLLLQEMTELETKIKNLMDRISQGEKSIKLRDKAREETYIKAKTRNKVKNN